MSNKTDVEYIYFLKGNTRNSHVADQIFLHIYENCLFLPKQPSSRLSGSVAVA